MLPEGLGRFFKSLSAIFKCYNICFKFKDAYYLVLPKSKILFCISVADILHHPACHLHIVWDFPVFHIIPDKITKNAPEIFMPGEGEKAAGIG